MPNNIEKPKRKKKIKWIIGGVVIIIILMISLCGKKDLSISVQTEKVTKRNITQIVTATGKIEPVNKVVITPEVTGEIVDLPVKEGDTVEKGQLLIKIKADTYIAQKDRAIANLNSSRANLKTKRIELDYAKTEFERVTRLFKSGIYNQQQVDKAQSDLSTASAQYDSLQAAVSQAEASLKESDESLKKTAIYSPMQGTVTQLNVKLGERVLGSGFSQGTNIMTVSDLTKMEATVEVDENDVILVSVGDHSRIEIDAFKNKQFNGTVSQIGNSAKIKGEGTQDVNVNFEIKIALDKAGENVLPGMSCNADIETDTRTGVLAVPIISVTARSLGMQGSGPSPNMGGDGEEGVQAVQKVRAHNKPQEIVFIAVGQVAKSKTVKTGISDDSYIEILEGLKEGDEVISSPYKAISKELSDGSKILIPKEKPTEKKPGSN